MSTAPTPRTVHDLSFTADLRGYTGTHRNIDWWSFSGAGELENNARTQAQGRRFFKQVSALAQVNPGEAQTALKFSLGELHINRGGYCCGTESAFTELVAWAAVHWLFEHPGELPLLDEESER